MLGGSKKDLNDSLEHGIRVHESDAPDAHFPGLVLSPSKGRRIALEVARVHTSQQLVQHAHLEAKGGEVVGLTPAADPRKSPYKGQTRMEKSRGGPGRVHPSLH